MRKGLLMQFWLERFSHWKGGKYMAQRRGKESVKPIISNGPGKLSQAMGITTNYDKTDLLRDIIWIEDRGIDIPATKIKADERIGVDYAGEDAKLPWRFTLKDSGWVSR